MQHIPYSTQSIDETDLEAVRTALLSGWLTQGGEVPAFEAAFARRHQVAHAVAVSSATAGLHIACLALGVGPGSRVWTCANSFAASANCARYCGADVDFVDIDPHTRNMSVDDLERRLQQAQAHGLLPDVVIPVHFAGLPCDLVPMRALADRYGFRIIEDASHATGALYQDMPIGSRHADVSVFSFHPVKIITTGEGGMVTTQDAALARRLQLLRTHGITREASEMTQIGVDAAPWHYEQLLLGFNYRMTDIQAALGRSQLARIESLHAARERLAGRYDQQLRGLPLRLPQRQPAPGVSARSSWHLYVVEVLDGQGVANRAQVFHRLRAAGVGANVHYEPIYLHPYYRSLGFQPGHCPVAEQYARCALSLPLYPQLRDEQQDQVVAELAQALQA